MKGLRKGLRLNRRKIRRMANQRIVCLVYMQRAGSLPTMTEPDPGPAGLQYGGYMGSWVVTLLGTSMLLCGVH